MYGYGFLRRGFTDQREISHGGFARPGTGLLLFWGDSPRDGRVLGVNMAMWRDMFLAEAVVVVSAVQTSVLRLLS